MAEQKIQYLSFYAINEFMNPDYRQDVVRAALLALPNLPDSFRQPIDRLTRQHVRVPGFRNGVQAPPLVKVRPIASAFEKRSDLVVAVLAAWAEAHSRLRSDVYDLLRARNWDVPGPEEDRTQLPGFRPSFPKGENFETINQAFQERYSDVAANSDDVSLMTVWVSGRLPAIEEEDAEVSGHPATEQTA